MSKPSKTSITPSDVILGLGLAIKKKSNQIKTVVFDPEETYERAIYAGRNEQFFREPLNLDQKKLFQDRKLLPMLAWNRSNLTPSQLNPRQVRFGLQKNGETHIVSALLEFNFNFTLYATNVIELEQFELDWNLQRGIREIAKIQVDLKNMDSSFIYSVMWEPELQSLNFSLDGNYYKSLSGSAKISGSFVSFTNIPESEIANLIKEIGFSIFDCNGGMIVDESFKNLIREEN